MACVNPDGTISDSAKALLKAASESLSPGEIAEQLGQPLFKVRSSIREMVGAGFLEERDGKFSATAAGKDKI